jgi:hypothetical protein
MNVEEIERYLGTSLEEVVALVIAIGVIALLGLLLWLLDRFG